MRTTLTLDEDVARMIEDAVHRDRKTFKEVVNEAIRAALGNPSSAPAAPYRVIPFPGSFVTGLDPARLNQLVDELDAEMFCEKQR